MKPQFSYALAAATGLLLVLIAPAPALTFLAPFALVPILIACAQEASPKQRFLMGWLAGILQWGATCYWIQGTLAAHGGMPGWLATLLFVLFALAKGLHLAIFSLLAGWLFGLRWAAPILALLWVGLERTHAELGFTWLLLGNAGIDMSVPMRLAPLFGVYGVSFVFALMSTSVAAWYLRRERLQLAWCVPLLALYLLPALPDIKPGDLSAVAVQPNIPEDGSLSSEAIHDLYDRMARVTLAASLDPSKPRPSLLLWPEAPASLYYDTDPAFRAQVASLARLSGAPFLFGTVRFDAHGNPFNTAQALTATGDPLGAYDKMNLVPFGEYVPPIFNQIVGKVSQEAGTFQPGTAIQIFPTSGGKLGPFICYESAFPHHVRAITAAGADVLVNLTNDGYFGHSAARGQHLRLARMRAAENARWLLRATNDGITASIDPAGRVIDELETYRATSGRLQYTTAFVTTRYTKTGDFFAWTALAIGLAISAWASRR
ncbi:apolipoprotein N-acyltransferase [Bryobacter aggregatus]|uniref:apolipoprotein N-acyltransferase n=1 Tax=Bryobacter aggregatus TaxID=360054 RepID=UPI0004E25447|nr:apolipoprotein N-acyltransferase [Bryobacter aggregatus]